MSDVVIVVTFSRIAISPMEVAIVFGGRPVVDGVLGLEHGKQMVAGTVYNFDGIGSAAIKVPAEEASDLLATLANESHFRLELDQELFYQRDVLSKHVHLIDPGDGIGFFAPTLDDVGPFDTFETDDLWNLKAIRAHLRNASKFTGKGVRVALIDSGIEEHADLPVKGGVSFVEGDVDPRKDRTGHGTRCAGIVAGRQCGVAPGADLYAIKVTSDGGAPAYLILAGLCWALRNGMDVISISLAGESVRGFMGAFTNAAQALMAKNCVVVAGAGDRGADVQFPANTPGFIAVGQYSRAGEVTNDSSRGGRGNQVTVIAPAERVVTTYFSENRYIHFNGSSAATPHIAGAIARLKEKLPGVAALQITARLITCARPLVNNGAGWALNAGAGLLDLDALLTDRGSTNKLKPKPEPQPQPRSSIMGITPDSTAGNGTADVGTLLTRPSLTVSLAASALDSDGSEYFLVVAANCDAAFIDTRRIALDETAVFDPLPKGRYYLLAVREGEENPSATMMVSIEEDLAYESTLTAGESRQIGKITVLVKAGGNYVGGATVEVRRQSNGTVVDVGTTNQFGTILFDLPDGFMYDITARVDTMAQTQACNASCPHIFEF